MEAQRAASKRMDRGEAPAPQSFSRRLQEALLGLKTIGKRPGQRCHRLLLLRGLDHRGSGRLGDRGGRAHRCERCQVAGLELERS